jgi:hypothetical protein
VTIHEKPEWTKKKGDRCSRRDSKEHRSGEYFVIA